VNAVEQRLADGPARGVLQSLAIAAERSGVEARRTLIANAVGFLTQAYEATAGLIGNTLLALAREPAARGARGRRADLAACVAEVARFDSPVHNTRRFTGEPCMLLGHQLATGDTVLVLLAAANRDPAVNPEPDRFEPGRAAPRMFTFGAGVHACPGAALATALAAVAVEAILDAGIEPEALERRFHLPVGTKHSRPPVRGSGATGCCVIAVIFEVQPREGRLQEYLDFAKALRPELERIDGFLSIERFSSLTTPMEGAAGWPRHGAKILSLSFFRDETAVAAWRRHAEHRAAQAAGRGGIFADYRLRIASVVRDYGMNERAEAPEDSRALHG
jgi:heme-degrading monooxygenase HmoA